MNHARILIAAVLLFSGCQDYRLGTFEAPSQECVNPSDWYLDVDGDGFGEAEQGSSCEQPSGSVADSTDCDDSSASIYPGATEVCGDGIDSDCDGYGGPEDDEDGDGFTFLEEQELGRDDCDPSFPGPNGDWTNVGRTTPIDDIWDAEFLGIDVGDYSGSAVDVGPHIALLAEEFEWYHEQDLQGLIEDYDSLLFKCDSRVLYRVENFWPWE